MNSTANWSINARRVRGLIDAIVLTPASGSLGAHVVRPNRRARTDTSGEESGPQIELRGNLAAMLTMAIRVRAREWGGS